jgi:hypothetical protein
MNVEAVVEVRGKSLSSQTLTAMYFAFYDSVRLGFGIPDGMLLTHNFPKCILAYLTACCLHTIFLNVFWHTLRHAAYTQFS